MLTLSQRPAAAGRMPSDWARMSKKPAPRLRLYIPSGRCPPSDFLVGSKQNPTTPVPAVPISRSQAIAMATAVQMQTQLSNAIFDLKLTAETLSPGVELDKLEALLAHAERALAEARAAMDRLQVRREQLARLIEIRKQR